MPRPTSFAGDTFADPPFGLEFKLRTEPKLNLPIGIDYSATYDLEDSTQRVIAKVDNLFSELGKVTITPVQDSIIPCEVKAFLEFRWYPMAGDLGRCIVAHTADFRFHGHSNLNFKACMIWDNHYYRRTNNESFDYYVRLKDAGLGIFDPNGRLVVTTHRAWKDSDLKKGVAYTVRMIATRPDQLLRPLMAGAVSFVNARLHDDINRSPGILTKTW